MKQIIIRRSTLILIVGFLLFSASTIFSTSLSSPFQSTTGTLVGTIIDLNDARVPSANIILKNQNVTKKITSVMNREYKIELPAGSYSATVERTGFKKYQKENVKIEAEKTFTLEIMLTIEPSPSGDCPPGHICLE